MACATTVIVVCLDWACFPFFLCEQPAIAFCPCCRRRRADLANQWMRSHSSYHSELPERRARDNHTALQGSVGHRHWRARRRESKDDVPRKPYPPRSSFFPSANSTNQPRGDAPTLNTRIPRSTAETSQQVKTRVLILSFDILFEKNMRSNLSILIRRFSEKKEIDRDQVRFNECYIDGSDRQTDPIILQ